MWAPHAHEIRYSQFHQDHPLGDNTEIEDDEDIELEPDEVEIEELPDEDVEDAEPEEVPSDDTPQAEPQQVVNPWYT